MRSWPPGDLQQAPLSSRASQLLQAARREPNQHSHGKSHSEQPLVKSASRRLSGRAVAPPAFPDPGNFLKMARLRNHGKTMQQKAHRGQFEAPAVVEHFWLIV